MSSVEVARNPKVRALRARLKRAEQELDSLKPWSSSASRPDEHIPAHRSAPEPTACAPVLPSVARGPKLLLRVAAPGTDARARTGVAVGCAARVLLGTVGATVRAGCAPRWPLTACGPSGYDPPSPRVCAGHHRLGRARRAQSLVGPTGPSCSQPNLGGSYPVGRHHEFAPPGRRLVLPGHVARPLLAQGRRLGRARINARGPDQRGAAPSLGRAPTHRQARGSFRLGQSVFLQQLQRLAVPLQSTAKHEPARQLLQ